MDGVLQLFKTVLNFGEAGEAADASPTSRTIDLQVGKSVHHDVPGNMRTELWLSVLARKDCAGAKAAKQYWQWLRKGVPPVVAEGIEKDVNRTFPSVDQFKAVEGQQRLQRVLLAYAAYDTAVGYCQGLNFLAALMLLWVPGEAEAFGCLVTLLQDRGMRELYRENLAMLQARLWQISRLLPRRLASHLEATGALPVLFASSWLLTAFAADFPIFFASRVLDVVLVDQYLEPIMKVCVEIVKRCEKRLLAMHDMEKMVQFLRFTVPRQKREWQQELLTAALAQSWTPEHIAVLNQTEGVESVVDTVRRTLNGEPGPAVEEEASPPSKLSTPSRLQSFKWAARISADSESPGGHARGTGSPLALPLSWARSTAGSVGSLGAPSQLPEQVQSTDLLDLSSPRSPKAGAPQAQQGTGLGGSSGGEQGRESAPVSVPAARAQPDWDLFSGSPHGAPPQAGSQAQGGLPLDRGRDRGPSSSGQQPPGSGAHPAGTGGPLLEGRDSDVDWGDFSALGGAAAEGLARGGSQPEASGGRPPLGGDRPALAQQLAGAPRASGGSGFLARQSERSDLSSLPSWGSFGEAPPPAPPGGLREHQ